MIVYNWGEIEYIRARKKMQEVHDMAVQDKQNYLILCSHPNVFTIGSDNNSFVVETIKSDRGGSITCHSPGQNIYYFCFQVKNPAKFYKKVLNAFESFFIKYLPQVRYDKANPGFYIQNRKIASLGFRYSQGVSLHGVALNVAVDLDFHAQVAPCNLKGVVPTSLENEGTDFAQEMVNKEVIKMIEQSFEDAV